jgi:hypothetical protein
MFSCAFSTACSPLLPDLPCVCSTRVVVHPSLQQQQQQRTIGCLNINHHRSDHHKTAGSPPQAPGNLNGVEAGLSKGDADNNNNNNHNHPKVESDNGDEPDDVVAAKGKDEAWSALTTEQQQERLATLDYDLLRSNANNNQQAKRPRALMVVQPFLGRFNNMLITFDWAFRIAKVSSSSL